MTIDNSEHIQSKSFVIDRIEYLEDFRSKSHIAFSVKEIGNEGIVDLKGQGMSPYKISFLTFK